MRILVGLALMLLSSTCADKKAPVVKTHSGSIRGFWQVSQRGRQFASYEGIPYAKPPVGELRFQNLSNTVSLYRPRYICPQKPSMTNEGCRHCLLDFNIASPDGLKSPYGDPPQPIGTWGGELPATTPGSKCIQYAHLYDDPADRVSGSEDCLYLNIYAPVNGKLFPVILYIHGGAFQYGQGSDQQPHYLMNEDVVYVSINYRLGPLGFLSTEDAVVPGNMGLKDQTLALRWITDNIKAFGGDPKQVTLTGLSAGGASVHYHYLSPMSQGLFQRGISLSGTALDCWTQTEASLQKAKKLGVLMGCPTSSNKKLVRCLRSRPAKTILAFTGEFMGWLYNPFTPFGPVIEKNAAAPFINKSPIEIMNSGEAANLPWITSVVSEEGLYPSSEFIANKNLMEELNKNWQSIAPYLLDYNYTIPSSDRAKVARKIRKYYLGNEPIDNGTATALIHMVGDRLFAVDAEKAARIQARVSKSPVWFYYFNYRGEFSLSEEFTKTKEDFGVSHGDDNAYLFYDTYGILTKEEDLKMSENLVKMWTSFATTGVPDVGIEWPSVDPSKEAFEYLDIKGPGQFRIVNNTNFGEKKFWSTIDFDENKLPGNSASAGN